jgi:hypothetical protein
MARDKKIQIIKHEKAVPLNSYGDIQYPSKGCKNTQTADGWYSKFPEKFYKEKDHLPLSSVDPNSWNSLSILGINCFDFKEQVQYKCPYNGYIHFWCVPVFVFSENIKFWIDRGGIRYPDMHSDREWMREHNPAKTKNGLSFTTIQRALLGPGYTDGTIMQDGSGYLYDATLALDNGDFLGCKVWMWFNK